MNTPVPVRGELSSWKEIARYLGVSVRAAQKWEKERGLPVRRVPGSRGRIFADPEEIDAWKRSVDVAGVPEFPTSRWRVVGAAVSLAVAVAAIATWFQRVPPQSWKVEDFSLIVMDGSGRELWRKAFDSRLAGNQYYRNHPLVWVGDLDENGAREVLFVLANEGGEAQPLICYDERGGERWRFLPGRPITRGGVRFDATFGIASLAVIPPRIVVAAPHRPNSPAQIALLSPEGKLLREYWHSGHLNMVRVHDMDPDGKPEIFLAGVSNGRWAATVVILDPDTFGGAADERQSPAYQIEGFPPGRERARLLFAPSSLASLDGMYNSAVDVIFHPDHFSVGVNERYRNGESSMYDVNYDLTIRRVWFSDMFRATFETERRQGRIRHTIEEEARLLERGFRNVAPVPK